MADTYKSWNHSSEQEPGDDAASTRRLYAIIIASLLVFALIAGAVGFVAKRHYDEKQREALEKATREDSSVGPNAPGTELYTNVYDNVEPKEEEAKDA